MNTAVNNAVNSAVTNAVTDAMTDVMTDAVTDAATSTARRAGDASVASRPRRGALALWGAMLLLGGCDRLFGPPKPVTAAFHATDITQAADSAPAFGQQLALQDPQGKTRTMADFKGKIAVVFFGYTQCPDVCPTTLAELAGLKQALGADGERVQAVFVTVDPERDTADVLKAYVGGFGADFVGLRGNAEQTAAAAKDFKVFYAKVPGKAEGAYTMDHMAGSFIFDSQGRVRLFSRNGTPAADLLADIRLLLQGA